MALGAFVAVTRCDGIDMIMSTSRTTESFRPALLRQRLGADFFRSVLFLLARQARFRHIHDQTLYIVDYEGLAK